MRFNEYFSNATEPVLSFELFPPKTDKGMDTLRTIIPELTALKPTYMTVTYGAMGTTQDRTLDIARITKNEFGVETACHLTCVGSSRSELDKILTDFQAAGINNIVALRGDPPQGETDFVPPEDGLAHGNEMVEHIRSFEKRTHSKPFGIAVAGYPEKHLEAADMDTDLINLKRKVDAGADIIITQLFYDNSVYFRFVEKARAQHITIPIVPGLMPIQSSKQIIRIASMCGASIPPELRKQLEEAGDDPEKAQEVGVAQCIKQAKDLLNNGAPGIHFYVLNKAPQMKQIVAAIR